MKMHRKQIAKGEIEVIHGKSILEGRLTGENLKRAKSRIRARQRLSIGQTNLAASPSHKTPEKSLEASLEAAKDEWCVAKNGTRSRTVSDISSDTLELLINKGIGVDDLVTTETITPDNKLTCKKEKTKLGKARPLSGARYHDITGELLIESDNPAMGKRARVSSSLSLDPNTVTPLQNRVPTVVGVEKTVGDKTFIEPMNVGAIDLKTLKYNEGKQQVAFKISVLKARYLINDRGHQRKGVFRKAVEMVELRGIKPSELKDHNPYKQPHYAKLWAELAYQVSWCYADMES